MTRYRRRYRRSKVKEFEASFIREILKVASQPEVISFAGGLPKPSLFPVAELRECFDSTLSERGEEALQYNRTEGYEPLREWIAERTSKTTGSSVSPEQVLITTGSQQGLDLIGKLLLLGGGTVAMEEPGYLGAKLVFSMYDATIRPLSLTDAGLDTSQIEALSGAASPGLVYGMPRFQNPTGHSFTPRGAKEVAKVIEKGHAYFVEDDPYGELFFRERGERVSVFGQLPSRAFYLGSFSKTVAPSFRIGYVVGPEDAIVQLTRAKQASDLHSSQLLQIVLHEYLTRGTFENHLETIRARYAKQKETMRRSLQELLGDRATIHDTDGGMFLWMELPKSISADALFDRAIAKKVAFVPGRHFFQKGGHNGLRLNFSNVDEETIIRGTERLAEAVKEELGG